MVHVQQARQLTFGGHFCLHEQQLLHRICLCTVLTENKKKKFKNCHGKQNDQANLEVKKKPYQAESQEEWHQELPKKQLSLNMPSALLPPPMQKQ